MTTENVRSERGDTMTDRTEQADDRDLRLIKAMKEMMEQYGMPEFKDNTPAVDVLKLIKDAGYTRPNSPDTVKLERLDEYQLIETMLWSCGAFKPEHIEEYRTIAKAICKRFGTVKVPTVEQIEEELRLHFDSFFHQVHFYIEIQGWYDEGIKGAARSIHQLLTGGEGK